MAPTQAAQRRGVSATLEDLKNYYCGLRTRVSDVPISIDFNTWRVNLSLLSMQTLILYGTLFSECRFSLFVFSSVWLGRSFFVAEYLKKYGSCGRVIHNSPQSSLLRSFSVSGTMLILSLLFLIRSTKDFYQLISHLLLPCACMVVAEQFRHHPVLGTPLEFILALEKSYFVGVVTLVLEVNPTLIYDRAAATAVISTAVFNNVMAGIAKYFILHFTQNQITAHDLHGWNAVHLGDDDQVLSSTVETWTCGTSYQQGTFVRHHGRTWEAVGARNQAEPGAWTSRMYICVWRHPFRFLTFLMGIQVMQVVAIGLFSFCCDSLMIVGGMMFVSADYMQLMHSIRFAMLGKSFRNVMLRPQSQAEHIAAAAPDPLPQALSH
ncbi:hypothetical protein H257_10781 [Aphanomyces astaci]|uniref:Uncharacterized protein n=4 Tax=Aphanomyces astaci TaxID=112090 RepID=W4G5U2_APHAT|nr:hypothetical protein H257_10781 [Aphanomyces astaci]ETV74651.1 hypothetical protein H257_10781 [Aphanomyces astaci]|eukprot:XP_009835738.1 hypothetical protein H257_10781 [Aphanomyces astaci]